VVVLTAQVTMRTLIFFKPMRTFVEFIYIQHTCHIFIGLSIFVIFATIKKSLCVVVLTAQVTMRTLIFFYIP
jgi:hypothetical protein